METRTFEKLKVIVRHFHRGHRIANINRQYHRVERSTEQNSSTQETGGVAGLLEGSRVHLRVRGHWSTIVNCSVVECWRLIRFVLKY